MIEIAYCPKCHVVSWERAVGASWHARGWKREWSSCTDLVEWMKSEGFEDLGSCDGFIKRCDEHASEEAA